VRKKRAIFTAILGLGVLPILSACKNELETGYKYTRLDMTDSEEKAMYADPFSEAAAEAHQDQQQDNSAPRAGPGGGY
jgi:hypothetical protein